MASGSSIDEVSDRERSEDLARVFGEVDREDRRDGEVGLGLATRFFCFMRPFLPAFCKVLRWVLTEPNEMKRIQSIEVHFINTHTQDKTLSIYKRDEVLQPQDNADEWKREREREYTAALLI